MSGAVFTAKGASTGQAPQTVWMQSLADRLTMLQAYNEVKPGAYFLLNTPYNVPPLFANQWVNYNLSLGSFTTAPDGTTNTAQHLTEDSSNNSHYIGGALLNISGGGAVPTPIMRIAGIFKADTRTRVCFQIQSVTFNQGNCNVGFDLSGGQIAYGPTSDINVGDHIFRAVNAEIHPVVGFAGWYLCIFDYSVEEVSVVNGFFVRILLDNGSGLAAQSITYTGNGTSGVYGWKTSMLPVSAWKINAVPYFNEFTNLNSIDLNNTKAPGFDLYQQCSNPWKNWQDLATKGYTNQVIPPGTLSIEGGTVLHIPTGQVNIPSHIGAYNLGFACQITPSGAQPATYAGRGWVAPYFMELNYKIGLSHAPADGGEPDWWGVRLECIINVGLNNPNPYITGMEDDICDYIGFVPGGGNGNDGPHTGTATYSLAFNALNTINVPTGTGTISPVHLGALPVLSNYSQYGTGIVVSSGGNFYKSDGSGTNSAPPANPPWTSYTYGTNNAAPGVNQPPITSDVENTFNTYGRLLVPYDPVTRSPGAMVTFFNGNFIGFGASSWTPLPLNNLPSQNANPYLHTSDWQQYNNWLDTSQVLNSGYDFRIDWWRISQ